jgi:hypothetical protein
MLRIRLLAGFALNSAGPTRHAVLHVLIDASCTRSWSEWDWIGSIRQALDPLAGSRPVLKVAADTTQYCQDCHWSRAAGCMAYRLLLTMSMPPSEVTVWTVYIRPWIQYEIAIDISIVFFLEQAVPQTKFYSTEIEFLGFERKRCIRR